MRLQEEEEEREGGRRNRLCRREASSSADAATACLHPSIGTHEVFISHRGIEMKRKFANHLYHSLEDHGIKAFLDMEELPEGHDVRPQMLEAVRKAIIQVPIFTTNFAESRWCLDELVEMMKSTTSTVFPVFYDVKSEGLRINKEGPFKEAIEKHRQDGKFSKDTINGWVDALERASWLEGFRLESYNGREGALVKDLVVKIEQAMQGYRRRMVGGDNDSKEVGLEKRVNNVLKLFHLEEKEIVVFVLLYGMGGIGKTTLARAISNRLGNTFNAASFVKNCRDKKPSQIQDHLFQDLLHHKSSPGDEDEDDERRECLERGLSTKKVLIILDDIHDFESIEKVLKPTSLHPGSRMLVTSRNQAAIPHKNDLSDIFRQERYQVQPMDGEESLRLFCFNAFKGPSPDPGFEELAMEVSGACDGLPLSLEVLGRHLSRKTNQKKIWEEATQIRLHKDIESRLKISYDDLGEDEREMFLDVACFLNGEAKWNAECFWDGLQMVGWMTGLERLVELCLVKVDKDKCLTMHDHLRDLGRGIVETIAKQGGGWSRVWDDKVLSGLLRSKKGLDNIRGLATSLPSLNGGLLSQMQSLRLLLLRGTHLDTDDGGLKGLEIVWLKCKREYSRPWTIGELDLEFLTVLELHSLQMQYPFSLGQMRKLRSLDMGGCEGLEELPEDFGSLESLKTLNVENTALRKLPSSLGN